MKLIRMLSLLIALTVSVCMVAATVDDIEHMYAQEKAKVDKTVKEHKEKLGKSVQQKRTKASPTKKATPAKAKAAKSKQPVVGKTTRKKPVSRTKKPTKMVETTPAAHIDKEQIFPKRMSVEEAMPVAEHHIAPDIKTLEPMTVNRGETFMIKRPASPNFGRTWKLHKTLPVQVEMVGKAEFVPAEHPGRNEGTMVFTFKAIKNGTIQLEFEKVYPAELRHKKPLKIRIIPVEIKEKEVVKVK